MPQEPKRRHSTERKGKRRASIRLAVLTPVACKNCDKKIKAHGVCKYCGYYKNKEVINVNKKAEKKAKKEKEEK